MKVSEQDRKDLTKWLSYNEDQQHGICPYIYRQNWALTAGCRSDSIELGFKNSFCRQRCGRVFPELVPRKPLRGKYGSCFGLSACPCRSFLLSHRQVVKAVKAVLKKGKYYGIAR